MNIKSTSLPDRIACVRAAAFTLTETMVAVALGAVMLAALYMSFLSGFGTVRVTRENLRATQIMVKRLESIRLCTFNQITNSTYVPRSFAEYYDPQSTNALGTLYVGTLTPTIPLSGTVPETYRTNMLLVTVSVTWTNGGLAHARSMQTYAAREGMESYVSIGK